jgi:hypothetical protein
MLYAGCRAYRQACPCSALPPLLELVIFGKRRLPFNPPL